MMGSKSNKKENEEFTNKAKQAGLNPEKQEFSEMPRLPLIKPSQNCVIFPN